MAEAFRFHAAAMDAAQPQPRFGTVESFNPQDHTARVLIQPEEVLTGWLPVLAYGAGNGWGVVCPPAIGAQVVVVPLDGDHESLAVLPGAWSVVDLPPQPATTPGGAAAPVNPGEMAVVAASGSYLRFNADGSVVLVTTGNLTASVVGNATVEATGSVAVTAGTSATIEAAGSIGLSAPSVTGGNGTAQTLCTDAAWLYLATHTHNDPQGGVTSAPIEVAPGNQLTSNFNAS